MLERIEKIAKTGLFEDHTHAPGCEFGAVTLVYGENGVGKSTLAAVLDSLRERNASEIIRRRSLPGDVAPTVIVRLDATDYTFNGQDWNAQPPYDTLEVFYPGFVTRNVHAATGVDAEHRRNLCEFVLGRSAVKKVATLALTDNEGRTALGELKATEKQLQLLIKPPDTLTTFVGLPHDTEIEQKLDVARAALKEAQSKEAILKRSVPKAVPVPTVEREMVAEFLTQSTDVVAADVGAIVKSHIKQHLDADGEKWLGYGAKHITPDDTCPFCAQDIAASELVSAIRSYFSAEYKVYTQAVLSDGQRIRAQLGSAVFAQLRSGFVQQLAAAAQWADVAPIDQAAAMTLLDEAESVWSAAATKLEPIVSSKEARPLEPIDPQQIAGSFTEYEQAVALLGKVNAVLATAANQIEARKSQLTMTDAKQIEERLSRLENQKTRFAPIAQDLLSKRNTLVETRNAVDVKKSQLKKEIDEDAAKVLGKYQTGINHYLAHFGCDIRIESVEPGFPSGKASVQYTLKAHGHVIALGVSETAPCFETVLSDGDKYHSRPCLLLRSTEGPQITRRTHGRPRRSCE